MHISILTVFPQLFEPFIKTSLIGRAVEQGKISFDLTDYFSYCPPKTRIDAPAFGHGAGMVIKPEVIERAIQEKERAHGKAFRIFFSPQGRKLDQFVLKGLAKKLESVQHLMLVSSRYEGIDARVETVYADMVLSIGDYVLMGGDLPAMVLLEGLLRLEPGIVGKQESVEHESFNGPFVDFPTYTAPVSWQGLEVPEVLRSGNHALINTWRRDQAVKKTVMQHFEWVRSFELSAQEKELVASKIPRHYCVLMHTEVLLPHEGVGTTSVTSMDIHDIARSAATYGIENYFLVTPLEDQQKIVKTLLDFWKTGYGIEYNTNRHQAVSKVELLGSFDEVIAAIEKKEGKKPLIIATSAKRGDGQKILTYYDQSIIWQQERPVLLVFGTGKGLSQAFMEKVDYLLEPVEGLSNFNHLSVRSAVAIILDRWFGLKHKNR
jgi:tRNA (guanine37-N1)-methyltransferase